MDENEIGGAWSGGWGSLKQCILRYGFWSFPQDFYSATLDALVEAKNDRLWFKTQLKLCALWFKLKEYGRAHRILKELHK